MTTFPVQEIKGNRVPIKHWTLAHEMESQAIDQLKNISSLPVVVHHIAVMPDVHLGKGATVGSVIAMKDAVAPACVGVDIGCGMMAGMTNLKASDLPDSLHEIRHQIERDIPVGFNWHKDTERSLKNLSLHVKHEIDSLYQKFFSLDKRAHANHNKSYKQLGTLGGGNHFIEMCLDENQCVWLMLHSGSRNIGKELAEIHIAIAKNMTHNKGLPDPDLAYFLARTPEMNAYRNDLYWAQKYAFLNRQVMFTNLVSALKRFFPEIAIAMQVNCHHNYVSEEVHFGDDVLITRKGAIFAGKGVMGIIPGSMGTKSYIVEGKGNPESFNSASHGAGRRMSRSKAKKTFSVKDLEAQTAGVECRKDAGVIDEAPGAYKDIDQVMENQSDLVSIVATLKQILCVKG